ncbi:roadblock/LC7 domain-containing protein [Prosthecobacter vanneervenii]|uniref:HTH Mu-type domain-containing protein n=1 Tax=Prosthecobacter vanneervenii TaxID=48466 RepID=A0A7W7Y8L7_9BACT|nr:roadblock/LC7 domain-containing protein [Prosthecobacter vanneervenii]MBB5031627.1 hypothetical protein [Prosthecobacter vanneervenii]
MELATLVSSLPAVIQAAIADDAGRLLACAGEGAPPNAAVLVLAHATLSAAAELGRRSDSGECLEIVQQHEKGVIYLHALPRHRLLLVHCHSPAPIPALRDACARLMPSASPPLKTAPIPALDLGDALHAEPRW